MHDTPALGDAETEPRTAEAAAAYLRSFERSTLPLIRALVAECCRVPKVDQRLATILEDIGQEFIGLSYPINEAAYAQQATREAEGKRRAKPVRRRASAVERAPIAAE